MPSPPTALVIVGRPPARPIAGLAVVAAVAVVAIGVLVDGLALAVGIGDAEALKEDGVLADWTKLNPPTAMTAAMPKSAKPCVKWVP